MRKFSLFPTRSPILKMVTLGTISIAALSGCSDGLDEPGPGGVSEGEAAALDQAAEIIEARQLPVDALPESSGDAAPNPAPEPPETPSNPDTDGSQE